MNKRVYNCIITVSVVSHRDCPMGNSGCFPQEKPAATELCYPTYSAHWVFMCFHNLPNSGMDCRSFNMRTNVNACDCEHKCIDTTRESALKVDCQRKIPCHTGESNLHQQCAGLMLYQLRDIPIPTYKWS